jgi:hypothetical protein
VVGRVLRLLRWDVARFRSKWNTDPAIPSLPSNGRLRDYARPVVAPRTYERYVEIVRLHIVPTLGRVPLTQLRPTHIMTTPNRTQTASSRSNHELAPATEALRRSQTPDERRPRPPTPARIRRATGAGPWQTPATHITPKGGETPGVSLTSSLTLRPSLTQLIETSDLTDQIRRSAQPGVLGWTYDNSADLATEHRAEVQLPRRPRVGTSRRPRLRHPIAGVRTARTSILSGRTSDRRRRK